MKRKCIIGFIVVLMVAVLGSCELFGAMETMGEFVVTSAEYIYDEASE